MSAATGLSAAEAAARLAAEGPNRLPPAERRGMVAIAAAVVREPMVLLLAAAAAIYLVIGDLHEALILAASIISVVVITVVQERKAERALEALRDLSSPRALVVRDGQPVRIAGADVVRGDVLILSDGDRRPQRARAHRRLARRARQRQGGPAARDRAHREVRRRRGARPVPGDDRGALVAARRRDRGRAR